MLAVGALAYLVIWPRLPGRLGDPGCTVHQHLASTGGLTDAIGCGVLIGVLVITPFPLWRRLRELPEWQRARPVMIAARLLGPVLLIATAAQGPYAPGAQEGILERALALLTATWICALAVILLTTNAVSERHRPASIDDAGAKRSEPAQCDRPVSPGRPPTYGPCWRTSAQARSANSYQDRTLG